MKHSVHNPYSLTMAGHGKISHYETKKNTLNYNILSSYGSHGDEKRSMSNCSVSSCISFSLYQSHSYTF